MENVSFENLWQLLSPVGEYCRRRKACEKRWNTFSPAKQQAIYRILQAKKTKGEYVSPNPYFAIDDNDCPLFLSGMEQERASAAGVPLVMVRYQGRFLVCTRETMAMYQLEFVRDVHIERDKS